MRQTPNNRVEPFRVPIDWMPPVPAGENMGYFEIPLPGGLLRVVACDGLDREAEKWEHVSVSLEDRCPTWEEMSLVKSLFWGDEETVLQFHPPKPEYVNFHPNCLHLWRLRGFKQPRPSPTLVGPK